MKRRSFLSSLCGLFAAPFVARKVEAAPVVPAGEPYVIAVDWARDSVPDRSSVVVVRVGADGSRVVVVRDGGQEVRRYSGGDVAEGLRLAKLGKA
jgi:hypothetical protein